MDKTLYVIYNTKMTDIPQKIKHHIDLFKDYSDERLLSITLQYAPQLEHHIAARLLLEERKRKAQNKTDAKILKAAKGANRWAMYAVIVAMLSLLFLVSVWTYEHYQPSIDTPQKTEKVTGLPAQQSSTIETSGTSNEKHRLSPKQLKTKNKQSEK
jgi:hypothetical protein